jgi:hypothetical protein
MEFIESERGNQKLNIKLKKNCGGQLSGGLLSCSRLMVQYCDVSFHYFTADNKNTTPVVTKYKILTICKIKNKFSLLQI